MPAVELDVTDITKFMPDTDPDAISDMIDDVVSTAQVLAPCLTQDDLPQHVADAAKAVMRGAVLRWAEAQSGTVQTVQAGPFSQTVDTTARRGGLLWPTEITRLQDICKTVGEGDQGKAFTVDLAPGPCLDHADICSINFGAGCSCGAILTQASALWG